MHIINESDSDILMNQTQIISVQTFILISKKKLNFSAKVTTKKR